jgi:hypothetical protein
MRIDNSYLSPLVTGEARTTAATGDATQTGKPAPAETTASTHVPSPELARLRDLLASEPDSRVEVLAQVANRLASGYYSTPDAALRTADAMLTSAE